MVKKHYNLSLPTLDAVHLFHQFAFLACLGILVPHLDARGVVIAPIAGIDCEALLFNYF